MNSILSVIPAIAATMFLFLSSLDGFSVKPGLLTARTPPRIDTRVESSQSHPLQSSGVTQSQLAFAGVPGGSNYALLISPQALTLNVIRVESTDLLQPPQVDLQNARPNRIALSETSAIDGTVPAPDAGPTQSVSNEVTQRVYLDIGVAVSGWNNAIRQPATETQAVSMLPPAAPVTEP